MEGNLQSTQKDAKIRMEQERSIHAHVSNESITHPKKLLNNGESGSKDNIDLTTRTIVGKFKRGWYIANICRCCSKTKTRQWRKGPNGVTLCNACGNRHLRNSIYCPSCYDIPKYRKILSDYCGRCGSVMVGVKERHMRSKLRKANRGELSDQALKKRRISNPEEVPSPEIQQEQSARNTSDKQKRKVLTAAETLLHVSQNHHPNMLPAEPAYRYPPLPYGYPPPIPPRYMMLRPAHYIPHRIPPPHPHPHPHHMMPYARPPWEPYGHVRVLPYGTEFV
eukprot:m.349051 g.349051  ORF g.349051 m.349051 type:complete len:279 (-) comp40055_c0_seq1:56-892(-)